MISSLPAVHIPLNSHVSTVHAHARENGRTSFLFFCTSILNVPCSLSVATFLHTASRPATIVLLRHRLRVFAEALFLWSCIQPTEQRFRVEVVGTSLGFFVPPPVFLWLFGNGTRPVLSAQTPIITATYDFPGVSSNVFDARKTD